MIPKVDLHAVNSPCGCLSCPFRLQLGMAVSFPTNACEQGWRNYITLVHQNNHDYPCWMSEALEVVHGVQRNGLAHAVQGVALI